MITDFEKHVLFPISCPTSWTYSPVGYNEAAMSNLMKNISSGLFTIIDGSIYMWRNASVYVAGRWECIKPRYTSKETIFDKPKNGFILGETYTFEQLEKKQLI